MYLPTFWHCLKDQFEWFKDTTCTYHKPFCTTKRAHFWIQKLRQNTKTSSGLPIMAQTNSCTIVCNVIGCPTCICINRVEKLGRISRSIRVWRAADSKHNFISHTFKLSMWKGSIIPQRLLSTKALETSRYPFGSHSHCQR